MILPYDPRRSWLQSFTAVIGSGLALVALLLGLLGLSSAALGVLGLGLAVVVIGHVVPRTFILPYRAWNKIARGLAELTRRVLILLIFHVVFRSVSRVGEDELQLEPPPRGSTMWTPYPLDSSIPHVETTHGGWITRFTKWATRSRAHLWTVCLLPFLAVLSALEGDDKVASSLSADVYTLY